MPLLDGTSKHQLKPESWLKSYGDYLFSHALLKVGDRETAEDIVQETFVSAIRAKGTFRGESSEKTWLTTILKNKITDYYRKKDVLKNSREYITETDDNFSSHYFDHSNGHWLKARSPHEWPEAADEQITTVEFERVLQHCIKKMPSRLVPVFIAKFIDDEDSQVICKVHDISTSNYWVMIHRAKVLVRDCLEKNWFLTNRLK